MTKENAIKKKDLTSKPETANDEIIDILRMLKGITKKILKLKPKSVRE